MARYKKMDPTWKQAWVDILRLPVEEGGYLQGRGYLIQSATEEEYDTVTGRFVDTAHGGEHQFCCLGVLKNLLVEEGHGTWTDHVVPGKPDSLIYEDAGELSDDDMALVGLAPHAMERLIMLNDQLFKSLPEIADFVEAHL